MMRARIPLRFARDAHRRGALPGRVTWHEDAAYVDATDAEVAELRQLAISASRPNDPRSMKAARSAAAAAQWLADQVRYASGVRCLDCRHWGWQGTGREPAFSEQLTHKPCSLAGFDRCAPGWPPSVDAPRKLTTSADACDDFAQRPARSKGGAA